MNEREREEEVERRKPIEYLERLKREFDKERFKELHDKEKGFKGDGGGP